MIDASTEIYDPHRHRFLAHPTSNFETTLHILKSSLGSGILAMPQAFSHVGITLGVLATFFLGLILTHALHLLIRSEYEACKRLRVPFVTYRETLYILMKSAPKFMRPFANILGLTVDFILIIFQLGVCCVYILFLAENIKKMVDPHHEMAVEWYMVITLFPLMLLNLIPNLKKLSPVSGISNVFVLIAVCIIVYLITKYQKSSDEVTQWGHLSEYPLFFGTTMFALVSVGVVVSVENNMKTPKAFVKPLGVLNISMTFIVVLATVVGILGYKYCVSSCSDTITLDLPYGWEAKTVQVLFIIAVLTSYSLQCYVPVEIIWRDYLLPRLDRKGTSTSRKNFVLYGVRLGLCVGTFLLALGVPRLGLFISLFGALCLAALGINFPALMEICVYHPHCSFDCRFWKDIFLFLLGVLGLVTGTYVYVYNIVVSFM